VNPSGRKAVQVTQGDSCYTGDVLTPNVFKGGKRFLFGGVQEPNRQRGIRKRNWTGVEVNYVSTGGDAIRKAMWQECPRKANWQKERVSRPLGEKRGEREKANPPCGELEQGKGTGGMQTVADLKGKSSRPKAGGKTKGAEAD